MTVHQTILTEEEYWSLNSMRYQGFSWPWPQVYAYLSEPILGLIDRRLIDLHECGATPSGLRLVQLNVSDVGKVLLRLIGDEP